MKPTENFKIALAENKSGGGGGYLNRLNESLFFHRLFLHRGK